MVQEEMTKREFGKEAIRNIIQITATVVASLIILSFTKFSDDKESVNKELQRLDKVKVDAVYVDKRCLETKDEMTNVLDDIKEQQKITNQDIKEILRTMPRK